MKGKMKFDKDQLKTLFLEHIEKGVFGVMVLMTLLLCWSAFGLSPYKGTPKELNDKASNVSQRLQSSTPPEKFEDLPPKRNLNGMLRRAMASVDPHRFPMAEVSRPYADRKVRRQQPALLAVLDPRARSGFGAIATSENGGNFGMRGGGMMAGGPEGMPGGMNMDEMMPEMMPGGPEGMMGGQEGMLGGGAGENMYGEEGGMMPGMMPGMERGRGRDRGRKKKKVEKPKPKPAPEPEEYALKIPGGAKLEGKYWVSVVGLIPTWDQEAEYDKVFRDATKTYPTDMPEYITCEVERAEVVSPGEASEFEPLDMDAAFEFMGKWAAEYPEMVDAKYLLPSLDVTEPLPPLVLANHDPASVRHPKIPLKDEALAAAEEAKAAAAEEAEKKKPRRTRMRGRGGAMSGGMPGGMPGMAGGMPGGMGPGMDPGMEPGMGSGMMMGMGGRMAQSSREKIEYKLFRFFDFDVKPGKTYKYRVRLVLTNPNFAKPKRYLADPKLAAEEVLYTDWSESTPEVFVPLGSELLAGDVNPKTPTAKVMVRQFDQENAITAVHVFDMTRGSTANEHAVKVPTPPKLGVSTTTEEEEIDFTTNATVVDLSGGDKLPAGTRGKLPGRVLVMRSDGELALLSQFDDVTKYEIEEARLEEFKNKKDDMQQPGMVAPDEGGGAEGFGDFFKDATSPKRRGR